MDDIVGAGFGGITSYEELQSGVYASLVEYMTSHQILRNGPFDATIHPDAGIDDLDKEKIRWFVGLAREKRQFPLQYSEANIRQILLSLHLITDDNRIKNAALLLFAKDVQKWFTSATIKCAHFYGTKIQKPIASQQIYGGNVFEMVDMAVGFVMSRIDQHVGERTRSAQVDVTPELPPQAVTEAIVNAVVHRSYTSNGSVQVMLFKDRLEVWNPGKLPPGMTIAKLNKEHTSNPVNPVLANPVYLAGYIEQMGTGTTDIINRCVENGLRKPEFHQDEDFRTVLWRPEVQVAGKVAGKVDKNIARIILAIRGNTVSTREIMAAMQLKGGDNFRNRYLYPSIESGYVSKLYPDSDSRPDQAYYLTEKGLQLLSELLKE
jgi:predicted HTH transcriptional regulator